MKNGPKPTDLFRIYYKKFTYLYYFLFRFFIKIYRLTRPQL